MVKGPQMNNAEQVSSDGRVGARGSHVWCPGGRGAGGGSYVWYLEWEESEVLWVEGGNAW